ncbi:MAG: bifunctional heptose 7-phosphate kinase/heptose 1-phosphate adenyltransferase, partial [Planctomycetes bacterium]|nr:bifunctional heptose 7-phosphate kinase/heptose 1-phosphate adenyltransferase [Planctomycetota bacterium]
RGLGVGVEGVVEDPERPTTVKVRMMGQVQSARRAVQQLLRVDYEKTHAIGPKAEKKVVRAIETLGPKCDAIVVSDYDKGVLSKHVMAAVAHLRRTRNIPTIADPKLGRDYSLYSHMTAVMANRYETELATGVRLTGDGNLRRAGKRLVDMLKLDYAVITLDRDGIFFYPRSGAPELIPTLAKDVYDVTGAGDMAVSVLGLVVGSGHSFAEAVHLANVAAGIECGKLGATPVSKDEILAELMAKQRSAMAKVRPLPDLLRELSERRRAGQRVAFTNGCFDLLHIGHIECIKYARRHGDLLVVGMNSDASVRQLKGPNRPILSQQERAAILAALPEVDYVVIFDELSVAPLIKKVRPDVLVKGGDVGTDGVVGRDIVESHGGKVLLAPVVEGISTTDIVARILERYKK